MMMSLPSYGKSETEVIYMVTSNRSSTDSIILTKPAFHTPKHVVPRNVPHLKKTVIIQTVASEKTVNATNAHSGHTCPQNLLHFRSVQLGATSYPQLLLP